MANDGSIIEEIRLWFQKLVSVFISFRLTHLINLLLIAFVAAVAGLVTERTFKNKLIGFSLCFVYLCYLCFFRGQQWVVPLALLVLAFSFTVALLGKLTQWLVRHQQKKKGEYHRWK